MKSITQLLLIRCYIVGQETTCFVLVVAIVRSLSFDTLKIIYIIVWRHVWWGDLYIKAFWLDTPQPEDKKYTEHQTQAITRSHSDPRMKKYTISQTRMRTVHSSLPTTGSPGCPPFLSFASLLLDFFFCFLVLAYSVCWYYRSIPLCI